MVPGDIAECECCDAEEGVAPNRDSDVAESGCYRDDSGRGVDCARLNFLIRVDDDLAVLRRSSYAAIAWRYSIARGGRGSRACEECWSSSGGAVGSNIEDPVAFFAPVSRREELPSGQPDHPIGACGWYWGGEAGKLECDGQVRPVRL